MTDELDRLKAAMRADVPPVDGDAKARALALARKNFDAVQGSALPARSIQDRPEKLAGFLNGVKDMFSNIGLRPALLTTSSLVVIGLGIVLVQPFDRQSISDFETVDLVVDDKATGSGEVVREELSVVVEDEAFAQLAEQDSNEGRVASTVAVADGVAAAAVMPAPAPKRALESKVGGLVAPSAEMAPPPMESRDRFANAETNPLQIVVDEPVSTFSIDVDTASYAFVRSALMDGYLPPAEAVRIEEMVNYFPYEYPAPSVGEAPFATNLSVFETPWNADTQLVHIGIQGIKPTVDDRPPLDLVFLIDTSGSMQDANKLPLLKQSFRLLLAKLRPEDKVAIVTYAGSAGTVLEPTSASNRSEILASLERLEAGGSTAGQAGLQQAYSLAESMADEDRIGRVILATDGDFNVGISDPEALKTYIEDKKDSGTYLSVLGFGRGNYNDALMQSLAQNGNGTAAYIDTLAEAQKVLVDNVSGALFPIANDVKIQVEFNPAAVAEYRLIGYETRALAREDFNNDKVDAGDIGAGHTVTAIYEITLVGSPAVRSEPLRYQASDAVDGRTEELGFLKLRYKTPGDATSQLITTPIAETGNAPTSEATFSAAIAGFGQLLSNDKYLGDWGYSAAIDLANASKGSDDFGYRTEAITMMRLALTLSE